jgi:hypothetical protein
MQMACCLARLLRTRSGHPSCLLLATAQDERRARGWPLAALLLSTTLGAKRKSATID